MTHQHITVTVVAFTSLILHARAETVFERELKRLMEQRERDNAAAIEPITRRYQASLDMLLKRATQNNDLDTAVKIREEMGKQPTTPKPNTPTATPETQSLTGDALKKLVLGNWVAGQARYSFNSDGTGTRLYRGVTLPTKWKTSSNMVDVELDKQTHEYIEFRTPLSGLVWHHGKPKVKGTQTTEFLKAE